MTSETNALTDEVVTGEWVTFKGGELEGKRPKVMCLACRERLRQEALGAGLQRRFLGAFESATGSSKHERASEASGPPRAGRDGARVWAARVGPRGPKKSPLCFQCYRAELDRERALKAAGELDTASAERFQSQLPFEPVDKPRLETLKADRALARAAMFEGVGRFAAKGHSAQIKARHALQRVVVGLATRLAAPGSTDRERAIAAAIHAAELQLPESWLPFVVSR